ncbi:outer membrane protein [Aminobacter sp. MDW-2]|uniref:outer membrane protein n=1 Tax=Aminobacter sp. MDW-2 TaxID=2666139 RepID=UPI0012AF9E7D|nr:outer membrane protein [Aminobacter sp. MDW-2]MRX34132.1 outer membrane beta-barrel protein [Aminobacter sp. MDW-2]QNH33176.1 porin family protein [Aminobacter sp. MDW-2]
MDHSSTFRQNIRIRLVVLLLGAALLVTNETADAGQNGSAVDWSGVYMGGMVGYGTGDTSAFDGVHSDDIGYSGAIGGLTVGYNKQFGNLVVGVEGDVSGAGMSGKGDGGDDWGCGVEDICTFRVDWAATLRARLGYAVGPVLPFVSAGVAIGRVSGELDGGCPGDVWCGSDTKTGWTAGGGLEWAFNDKWSAKAEHLFVDLGRARFGEGNGDGFLADFKFHTARLGVNYHF